MSIDRRTVALVVLALALPLPMAAGPARADWDVSGEPVYTGLFDQWPGQDPPFSVGTAVCGDGAGGLICAFQFTTDSLRIQRLDAANGSPQWNGTAGVSVTAGIGVGGSTPRVPHVVADGFGGAWVAWVDARIFGTGPGVYVQRYDHDGGAVFAQGGLRVSGGPVNSSGNMDLDVDVTPSGRLLLGYFDGGTRVRRVSGTGVIEFGSQGALCASDSGSSLRLDLMADGEGAVLVWESLRSGQAGLRSVFANRVNASGTVLWGAGGVQVFSAAGATPQITHGAWEGNTLFVSWEQNRTGGYHDVHAQKLDASGALQWGTSASGGVTVLLAPDTPWNRTGSPSMPVPQIVGDGGGGCILAWKDERDYDRQVGCCFHRGDIYAQRLDGAGVPQWTANGAPVDTALGNHFNVQMVSDGAGGAILAYSDFFDLDLDLTARRIDGSGASLWARSLTGPLGDDNGSQDFPSLASDGAGGLLCAWWSGGGGVDCYATHRGGGDGLSFVPALTVVAPNGGEELAAGQVIPLTWTSNAGGGGNVRLEYQRAGFARQVVAPSTPDDGSFLWTIPSAASPAVKVYVSEATTGTPADSSDAPFSICGFTSGNWSSGTGAGSHPHGIVLGDFNEDGITDIAAAGHATGQVAVIRGLGAGGVGNGTFTAQTTYAAGTQPSLLVAEDFNEDGITDIAATVSAGVAVLLGNGSAGVGDGTFAAPAVYGAGGFPEGIAAGDFNEDGITDLAVANSGTGDVSIMIGQGTAGTGSGAFATVTNVAIGAFQPALVVTGDFNEDGITDLVVSCDHPVLGRVVLLQGLGAGAVGDGTFATPSTIATIPSARALATGDFNDDDITDLVVGDPASSRLRILTGLGAGGVGDGSFIFNREVAVGADPFAIVVADVNTDGIADLAVADTLTDEVRYAFGDGNGYFTDAFVLANQDPYDLALGDFLEDGVPDLACTHTDFSSVAMYMGGCTQMPSTAIAVAAPNGGELWAIGAEATLTWTKGDGVIAVNVDVSRDDGLSWERVARHLTGTSFAWTVTGPPTALARVRISDDVVPNRNDASDATFVIGATTAVTDVPRRSEFAPVRPNPSHGAIRLRFAVPAVVRADVGIFDLQGRRVATVHHGMLEPGFHTLEWDGRDGRGAALGDGVYFARACWSGFEATRKIVRAR